MEKLTDYEIAKSRVKRLQGFYVHIVVYTVVNLSLLVINLVGSPHYLWFLGSLLGWGVGLAAHALFVYAMGGQIGSGWQERKIRTEMERAQQRTKPGR